MVCLQACNGTELFARGFIPQSEAIFFNEATREIQEHQYQTGVSEKL